MRFSQSYPAIAVAVLAGAAIAAPTFKDTRSTVDTRNEASEGDTVIRGREPYADRGTQELVARFPLGFGTAVKLATNVGKAVVKHAGKDEAKKEAGKEAEKETEHVTQHAASSGAKAIVNTASSAPSTPQGHNQTPKKDEKENKKETKEEEKEEKKETKEEEKEEKKESKLDKTTHTLNGVADAANAGSNAVAAGQGLTQTIKGNGANAGTGVNQDPNDMSQKRDTATVLPRDESNPSKLASRAKSKGTTKTKESDHPVAAAKGGEPVSNKDMKTQKAEYEAQQAEKKKQEEQAAAEKKKANDERRKKYEQAQEEKKQKQAGQTAAGGKNNEAGKAHEGTGIGSTTHDATHPSTTHPGTTHEGTAAHEGAKEENPGIDPTTKKPTNIEKISNGLNKVGDFAKQHKGNAAAVAGMVGAGVTAYQNSDMSGGNFGSFGNNNNDDDDAQGSGKSSSF